jgi:ABC-type branched-subunit amino acid transport system ATPase component
MRVTTRQDIAVPTGVGADSDGLRVEDLLVRFGGLIAVDGVNLSAPLGRVTGLVGPNGAGKTTTFNACTGLNRPTRGRISLFGDDVTRSSPQARAQRGLGRTFQRMELYDSLPVAENVALGLEARLAGQQPWRLLVGRRGERADVQQAAAAAMERCGITGIARRRAADLSTGQRRLVELARAVAGNCRVLLLDEPSSGLDRGETEAFGEVLRGLVRDEGRGLLLVEHDMSLVMNICDYVYVLDFGRPIFEGTAAELAASPIVRAAYLGSDETAPELSSFEAGS